MSTAHYILQVNIYLIVFYGFYKLLLDKETYFLLNRIYLLSAGILSLAIPFLRLEWFTRQTIAQPVYIGVDQFNELITQVVILEDGPEQLSTSNMLVILYLAGVLFFAGRLVFQLCTVRILLKKVVSGTAFSFFNKKRIDHTLPEIKTIEKHESIHMRQLHTLDVLLFEVMGIVNWFNPVIYLYKNTIKDVHEYLADEEAAKYQGDKEQYALLILSTAFGLKPNQLTNSFFNKSLIKKRILMLHKQRSRRTAILKYGLFIPLFAMALTMSSATIRDNKKIQSIADDLPLDQSLTLVTEAIHDTKIGALLTPLPVTAQNQKPATMQPTAYVENTVQENVDWKDFYSFIMKKIKYPLQAQESGLQGNAQIKFTIKNGEIEDLGIAGKPLGAGCDAEVMRTILTYKNFKESVNGKYIATVTFRLQSQSTPIQNEKAVVLNGYKSLSKIVVVAYNKTQASNTNSSAANSGDNDDMKIHDFVSIDTQPGFPGGMRKFYEYLSKSVKYPPLAKENNIQGKVYLSFIVEKDGSLNNIKVDRKLGSGTDEEALRVLHESPKWTPGIKDGQTVRVKYNIPISFTLRSNSAKDTLNKSTNLFYKSPNATQPLILLNGVKVSSLEMKNMNRKDIETVKVIKDEESLKTFGDAGKYGVISITTKKDTKQ